MGLFYNGNNPLNLRDGYASSDFDRTHVINFNYVYRLPDFVHEHNVESYFTNGWSLVGLTILQSGQPYSVIDFSGAVGSIYYGVSNGITNPIVPLAPGCTAKSAKTGLSGAFGDYALKSSCFTIPLLEAGGLNGAVPTSDPYENTFTTGQRNIFRQAFQKRWDASIVKMTQFTDRFSLKYTFDVYNLTNYVPASTCQEMRFRRMRTITASRQRERRYCRRPAMRSNEGFYNCPAGLGVVSHTIGSARQIQMSLELTF